ncbi:MAG: TlpA family protein disulfide reductase [Candidatus Omnitrophica bacterium]|nr:TlpA family protein disulfide reductase [Candidatus Omnitrophota bacterium]
MSRENYKCGLFFLIFILVISSSAFTSNSPSDKKDFFRDYQKIEFNLPRREADLVYLGLKGLNNRTFKLSEINAKVVILEIVTAYCPYCSGSIPEINGLCELIKHSPYAQQIKLLGIGMANSEEEIEAFRDKYAISFPVFADEDNKIYKVMGRIDLPYWTVLYHNPQGVWEEIYAQSGKLPEAEKLLDLVLEKTGLSRNQ